MHRRTFIHRNMVVSAAFAVDRNFMFADSAEAKRITDGNRFYWFGYYDKFQIDATGRYALGCSPAIEHRSPTETDALEIGIIDLEKKNSWRKIGVSKAWGWQQGCMLQWLSGGELKAIWNDREGDQYVSRVYDVKSESIKTLPRAIYTISPDGKFALGTEFNRIQNLRPGYGYAGIDDPYKTHKAPDEIGLYRMDLATGESGLLLSIAKLAGIEHQGKSIINNWHWFNHLLVSPDSNRFLFLHRWREKIEDRQIMASRNFSTRMITANLAGDDLHIADPSGNSSHFIWRDPKHICVWTKPNGKSNGFWLIKDKTDELTQVGEAVMTVNGHNTYVPNTNNEWILNDTYPDKERIQTLYLYHIPSNRKVVLGRFYSPPEYKGEWRCDLHPRCNQQGTEVFFDSTHEGLGRQMYRIDISRIVR